MQLRRLSPGGASGEDPACQCRRRKTCGFHPWVGKIPWRRKWLPIPVFLPGKFHRQRSLVGYRPRGHKESDRTEHIYFLRLWSKGSVDAAHGLNCPTLCGIFPDQGLNPCPLYWQADSYPLPHQGSLLFEYFNIYIVSFQ